MMRSSLIVLLASSILSTAFAISCYNGEGDSYQSLDCTVNGLFENKYCVKVTNGGVATRSCALLDILCTSDGCQYNSAGDAYCCCSTNDCNLTSTNSPFVAFAAVVLFALYLLK